MAENNQLVVIKSYLQRKDIRQRFEEMLDRKAPQFMASIVNLVSASPSLQKCDPNSIMSAAFVAASFDLPIDQNLGFSAIVPYGNKAQFQMMWRGFVQLAVRSGQYKAMNSSEVYEDEILNYNPITKEISFVNDFRITSFRNKRKAEKIVGYYAWFELLNGFKQQLYMTTEEIINHAKQYSKSYQYDLRDKKKTSKWTTDFNPMAKKTVIKLLLSKWGILSIDMQKALTEDQKVFNDNSSEYQDNPETKIASQFVDPFANKEKEEPKTAQENALSLINSVDQEIVDQCWESLNLPKIPIKELPEEDCQRLIVKINNMADALMHAEDK